MLPILSWKNVWRNRTRSLVVIIAMMIGVFSGTFIIALATGVIDSRSQDVINNETSHIQIHHKKYGDYFELQYFIPNIARKIDSIKALPQVKGVNYKFKNMAMTQAGDKRGAMYVSAIDPETDTAVFNIHTYLKGDDSKYLDNNMKRKIVVSEAIAKSLQLEYYVVDSVSLVQLASYELPAEIYKKLESLSGETFKKKKYFTQKLKEVFTEEEYYTYRNKVYRTCDRYKLNRKINLSVYGYTKENKTSNYKIVGYYKTNDGMFDGMNAFILKKDFEKHAHMPKNSAHEIDITLNNKEDIDSVKASLEAMFPQLKVSTYRDLKPEIALNEATMEFYTYIIMGIILFALAFGIVNTMLMAVLERTKEIGMLKAIGMNRKRVFMLILYETVYLGLVGSVVGMFVGYFSIKSLEESGINLSQYKEGFEAMGYSSVLYPKLEPVFFFQVTILVVLTGVLASVIPAIRALKLNPAEAVRSDV